MQAQIPPSSRISDLIHVLSDPIRYVSGVLNNFVLFDCDPETSVIRIGVTGTGVFPHYRVEEPKVPVTLTLFFAKGSRQSNLMRTPARTFNGRNHREMTELDDHPWHDDHWSAETMSFAELEALLSSISRSESEH
jgi:hypothetical protein